MSKSQPGGDAAIPRSRSTCLALYGTIFLMALLIPAPARGLPSDDKDSAGKDAAKKDATNKDATNKDNKTAENSNLTDREILQQLLQQIQLLQTRVAELEAKEVLVRSNQPAPPAAVASPAAVSASATPALPAAQNRRHLCLPIRRTSRSMKCRPDSI